MCLCEEVARRNCGEKSEGYEDSSPAAAMNPRAQINLLTSRREHFIDLGLFFLNRIKPEHKKHLRLNILSSCRPAGRFNRLLSRLQGIDVQVITRFPEYLDKVRWAAAQPCEYQAKLDEDVFCSEHVLNYMFENLDVLKDSENITLSPLFSNGIPTTDDFIAQFFDSEDRNRLFDGFLRARFGSLWGFDYSSLNQFTEQAETWNAAAYYKGVASLPQYLKGIHPVRITEDVQLGLNDLILRDASVERFLSPGAYEVYSIDAPYLCNNFFFIRNEEWNQILSDGTLFRDAFDEVPLSLYKQRHSRKFLFVRNGFAVHTMYNTISNPSNDEKETAFVRSLHSRVMGRLGITGEWTQSSGLKPWSAPTLVDRILRRVDRVIHP